MTKEQYYEMVENFADYANKEVTYKRFNVYYGSDYGEISKRKYNTCKGILRGVGINGNAEHLILADYGHRSAIHYRDIEFPKC